MIETEGARLLWE